MCIYIHVIRIISKDIRLSILNNFVSVLCTTRFIAIMLQLSRCIVITFLLLELIMDSNSEEVIIVTKWGSINGRSIEKYTLKNKAGQEVDIITYGATITSVRTPDKLGNIADVVLGFDNVEDYASTMFRNPYFGATVGRVANRIKNGEFILNGNTYHLTKNLGQDSLHGGINGWSWKIWNAAIQSNRLVLSLLSEDGDEGYPGDVVASVIFQLFDNGELRIKMKAFVTKATPINLTNHSYFNLAGHNGNASELYKHQFTLNADRWTATDAKNIPTGDILSVIDTAMDLRNITVLGDVIDKIPGGGYDNNFCLIVNDTQNERNFVATAVHPTSGRYLEVFSNQPAVQFYTANFLPEHDTAGIQGKNGSRYFKHAAFCLETQNYPDAVNHANFPNSIVEPGQIYRHIVIYKFGVIA
ncbi:PREDICTED: aldose 1-epimerase [Eufriesea mexicana]|uniref:aldose 1-epimerase n=1 Tax=Eufriesea mexicana TaxID=516756 RepID=UPI00083C7347|nr:PREDICTED: aldose 1-epimerase [Eufriesea mexicana]